MQSNNVNSAKNTLNEVVYGLQQTTDIGFSESWGNVHKIYENSVLSKNYYSLASALSGCSQGLKIELSFLHLFSINQSTPLTVLSQKKVEEKLQMLLGAVVEV